MMVKIKKCKVCDNKFSKPPNHLPDNLKNLCKECRIKENPKRYKERNEIKQQVLKQKPKMKQVKEERRKKAIKKCNEEGKNINRSMIQDECYICGNNVNIEPHHVTYNNPEIRVNLCKKHHFALTNYAQFELLNLDEEEFNKKYPINKEEVGKIRSKYYYLQEQEMPKGG